MRKFVTAAFLAMATMTISSAVEAKPPSGGSSGHSGQGQSGKGSMSHGDSGHRDSDHRSGSERNYHIEHGRKFSQGYYYSGRDHYQWSYSCYWPRYSCDCYYCPSACCWYYWCEPRDCYLPTSCVEYAAPTVTTQVNVQNTNTNTAVATANAVPVDLPPVIPVGPSGAGPVQPFKGGPGRP